MYKGIFIDDLEEIYAELLSTPGHDGLKFTYMTVKEPVDLSNDIFTEHPDIVAIDFRLDENPSMIRPDQSYKGSTLAQLLRDQAVFKPIYDFFIVLITSEQWLKTLFNPDKTAHDLFDMVYTKERVSSLEKTKVRDELISLCEGYKILRSIFETDGNRLSILNLPSEDRKHVAQQELRSALEDAASPHHVAGYILINIIGRAGLLLSDADIAARLGCAEYNVKAMTAILTNANIAYSGIFHAGWRRWWAHRFNEWAEIFFGTRPTSLTGDKRVTILNEKLGLNLQPARSSWNDSSSEKFAFACSLCGKPTEARHALEAFDPRVPIFSQARRICWDCIQTGKYHEKMLKVSDIDVNLVKEIESAKRDD